MRTTAAVLLVILATPAWAADPPGTVQEYAQQKTEEYGTKTTSIFAPLGFTIGGGAALVGGSIITGIGGLLLGLDTQHQTPGLDYGVLGVGCVALTAGAILLGYGIYRWIARSRMLSDRYGS
jgi:hypothetical protein